MASTLRTIGLFSLLIGIFVVFGALVGAFFGNSTLGMGVFLVFAIGMNFATYFWSDKFVLWTTGAKIVTEEEAPRLYRIVRQLVQRTDLPMPRVAIIPTMTPNAFATGRNPKNAVVAATNGILHLLDDDELSGVMAHELAHVKNRDVLIMAIAATVAGAIALFTRMIFWGAIFGGGNRDNGGGILGAILVGIIAGIAALLVQFAISRAREYKADAIGAEIHGRPGDLARALQKLHRGVQMRPMRDGNPATSHLYIVNPFTSGRMAAMFSTHPPMEERVRRLEAMRGY